MAPKNAAAATAVIEPEAIETPAPIVYQLPAAVADEDGFVPDARWVRFECVAPDLQPRPGYKPLWAEFDMSLSIAEAEAIPWPNAAPAEAIYPYICPRVRAWNVKRLNQETGKLEPVPPPAEIGGEAFRYVSRDVYGWIVLNLKLFLLNGGLTGPKGRSETSESDGMSDGMSDVA